MAPHVFILKWLKIDFRGKNWLKIFEYFFQFMKKWCRKETTEIKVWKILNLKKDTKIDRSKNKSGEENQKKKISSKSEF